MKYKNLLVLKSMSIDAFWPLKIMQGCAGQFLTNTSTALPSSDPA